MDEPKTLEDLLASIPEQSEGEYKPGLHVPEHGDCAFVYLENAPYRAVYIDPFLTVFEAFDDERLVGFQIKGLSQLQET